MILTCPECATSYFVDASRVPAEGRTVKCSSCGTRWRAFPEAETAAPDDAPGLAPEPEAPGEPAIEYPSEPLAAEVVEEAGLSAEPPILSAEDVEIIAEPKPAEAQLRPRSTSRPAAAPPRKRPGVGAVVGWAAAALVVVAVTSAVLLRDQIVRRAPAAGPIFAGLGLPTDSLGLVIDEVKFQPMFQGGRPVLSVTGAIRNTRDQAISSPALRVSLLDKAGKPLAARIARPLNAEIPAGAKRYFAIAIADPPAGSQTLDVAFEPRGAAPAAPTVEAVLAPEPVDAVPLSEDPNGAPANHG